LIFSVVMVGKKAAVLNEKYPSSIFSVFSFVKAYMNVLACLAYSEWTSSAKYFFYP